MDSAKPGPSSSDSNAENRKYVIHDVSNAIYIDQIPKVLSKSRITKICSEYGKVRFFNFCGTERAAVCCFTKKLEKQKAIVDLNDIPPWRLHVQCAENVFLKHIPENNPWCDKIKRVFGLDKEQAKNTSSVSRPIMVDTMKETDLFGCLNSTNQISLYVINSLDLSTHGFITCTVSNDNNINMLGLLTRKMQYFCAVSTAGYRPAKNELCLVLSNRDNMWHRAICIQKNEDSIDVFLLDKGYSLCVKTSSIIAPLPIFATDFPIMGSLCKIEGIPNDNPAEVWSVINNFFEGLRNRIVSSVSYDYPYFHITLPKLIEELKRKNLL